MNHSFRTLSVIVALGLLVAVIGAGSAFFGPRPVHAAATVAENTVEWTAANGDSISFVTLNVTSNIYILDDALETTKGGTAVFSGIPSSSKFFDVAGAKAGTSSPGSVATTTVTAVGYSTSSPSTTPWTGQPTVTVGASTQLVTSFSVSSGTATVFEGVSADTTVAFNYNVVDSWDGQSATLRRAKITSTSDPAGEYVTISEVTAVGTTSTNATSRLFHGTVLLSSDAALQGTNNDGVWVSNGDVVTATYLDSAGATVDTDTMTVDAVEPSISSILPADGTITTTNNPTVQFDVTDAGAGISTTAFSTDITLKINDVTVTPSSISYQSIADGFRAIFAQGTAWTAATSTDASISGFAVTDSLEFSLEISATDQAGNTKTVSGTSANVTIDKSAPTLAAAQTGAANTAVTVTFSEILDAATVDADGSDFTVAGVTVSAAAVDATNLNEVDLTVSALAADAKPDVTVSTVSDKAGNVITGASVFALTLDRVPATLTTTVSKALAILADPVKVTVATDEKLGVGDLTVSIHGPSGATAIGLLTTTSPTPNNNEGTVTVVAGHTSGTYGVAIRGIDTGPNTTNNLTTVTAETPTISADRLTLTLANGPIADSGFDGTVTASDVTVFRNATTTGAPSVTAVDASARTITLGSPATSTSGVAYTVTYDYVGTDTFQIDQLAPTVTMDPATASTIQNQSPFIRLIFDEDEYPGDSYKTVSLTKAELTKPDATTEDLLASFTTADNIEFIWSATDLALGAYTLKISATDTGLNALTDSALTFTIAKRTMSIALRPGWNLISLPDSPPADAKGINDVITTDKVDIVLTYDPTVAGNWLSARRQADGTLGGVGDLVLTEITARQAYWVHSTDIVTLTVDVPGIAPGAPTLPPSFKLVAGWNLVPYATSDLADTDQDADEYFTGLDWSRAFGYDNASNKFVGILPTVIVADNLSIGKGYWVFLNKAGTLVPP